jgi:hypothetical protein
LTAVALGAALGMASTGCAVGAEAVRHDKPPKHHVNAAGPGFIGDPTALLGVVLERLDADPSAITCAHRAKRVVRCQIERDTGGPYPDQTYVDARISRNGKRLSVAGPGVARFTERYAGRHS